MSYTHKVNGYSFSHTCTFRIKKNNRNWLLFNCWKLCCTHDILTSYNIVFWYKNTLKIQSWHIFLQLFTIEWFMCMKTATILFVGFFLAIDIIFLIQLLSVFLQYNAAFKQFYLVIRFGSTKDHAHIIFLVFECSSKLFRSIRVQFIVPTKLAKPRPPWLLVAMSHMFIILATSALKFSRW